MVTRVVPLGANTQDPTSSPWPVRVRRWDQSLVHHTHAVLSYEVVTRVLPSGANAHELTNIVWPVRVCSWDQSLEHHTRAVVSAEVVTRVLPSGANAHVLADCVWPQSTLTVRTERQSNASGARSINSWTRLFHCLRVTHHQTPLDSCPPSVCIKQFPMLTHSLPSLIADRQVLAEFDFVTSTPKHRLLP